MDSPTDKFRKQVNDAWRDLHLFENLQRFTEERIDDLRELIRATANFLPDTERSVELLLLDLFKHPTNITEAVRVVLYIARGKSQRMTPTQIKEEAESRGFSFSEYTNPMASIHTTLRRMKESDPPEVEFNPDDGSYLLTNNAFPGTSPAIGEQIRTETFRRLASADAKRLESAMDEVASEIIGAVLEKAKPRKKISE